MQYKSSFLLWGKKLIDRGAPVLSPLSMVWKGAVLLKNGLYDRGCFSSTSVGIPVVSIGNVVAGGAGKTPLLLFLVPFFSHRKVAVLSRGYGPFPDEPVLIEKKLPWVKVYVGKDRVSLAKQAVQEGAEIIFLDDGMQYRKLKRDVEIAIVRGKDPLGKGHYLPRGYLRDDPSRLKTADLLFVNGEGKIDIPHVELSYGPLGMGDLKEKKVALFSGIAHPEEFRKTVLSLGAIVVREEVFADHALVSEKEISLLAAKAKREGAALLLCTEKDFVKIDPEWTFALPIIPIPMAFQIRSGKELWEKLFATIEQKIDASKLLQ